MLAVLHDQGVKLVEPLDISRKLPFHHPAHILVFRTLIDPTVANKHPLQIGVDNKHPVLPGIEQNGIGGLRAYAKDAEKPGAGVRWAFQTFA